MTTFFVWSLPLLFWSSLQRLVRKLKQCWFYTLDTGEQLYRYRGIVVKNVAMQWWSPESHALFPFVKFGRYCPFLAAKNINITYLTNTLGIFLHIGHISPHWAYFLHISIVYWLIGRGQDSCDSSTGFSLSCRPNWLPALHCFKLYHYHYNRTSNFPS